VRSRRSLEQKTCRDGSTRPLSNSTTRWLGRVGKLLKNTFRKWWISIIPRARKRGRFKIGTTVRHSAHSLFVSFGSEDLTFPFVLVRNSEPYLAKFRGKPGRLSPKTRLLMFVAWLLPPRLKSVRFPSSHSFTIFLPLKALPKQHRATIRLSQLDRPPSRRSLIHHRCSSSLPTAAPCSVSTSSLPSIVVRVLRLVSKVGRRPGRVPQRGRIEPKPWPFHDWSAI